MRENRFQSNLIKELEKEYPGCIILKNNSIQGFPDLTILYEKRWATLECKRAKDASHQPNQDYYVNKCNSMSYSAFIYPENKKEVLHELQSALKP